MSATTMRNDPAVEFAGISMRLGSFEAEFSFKRAPGSITAIMGPSGSGKSTLLNLLAGFLVPNRGRIFIGGRDVTALAPGERGISMVFQENNLFAHLDIRTNIGLGIDPSLRLGRAGKEHVENALERVGLSGFGARLPGTLSGGERQRVALARAFVRRKPLLLLDEPFGGLGPGLADDMLTLMLEIRAEVGASVLMITHGPDEARRAAGEILFIEKGRIIADAAQPDFFARTDLPAIARYLGGEAGKAMGRQD